MNRNAIFFILSIAISALKYHEREMRRAHDHGWNGGWEAGKKYARGEYDHLVEDDETGDSKESK